MNFYFELEDRIGQRTSIPDPVGWDSMTFILERDNGGKHGVFFSFQANPFTYDGEAGILLRDEYEMNGVEGEMYLIISFDCGTGIQSLDKMRFVFTSYEQNQGSECSVTIPVETLNDALILRNRIDQKVDLMSTVAFDEVTPLTTYAALPFTKTIPPKGIAVADHATNPTNHSQIYQGTFGTGGGPVPGQGRRQMIFSVPGFKLTVASEIGGFTFPVDASVSYEQEMEPSTMTWFPPPTGWLELPYWNGTDSFDRVWPYDKISPIINYDASLGNNFGFMNVTIEGRYRKNVFGVQVPFPDIDVGSRIESAGVYLGIINGGIDPTIPSNWTWLSPGTPSGGLGNWNRYPYNGTQVTGLSTDFTFNFNFNLKPGDRVYFFDKYAYRKLAAYTATTPALELQNVFDSYFKTSGLSVSDPTDAKLFMLNEAFSHVSEAITDGKFRFYSDFFGRTDSQPYSTVVDGCGSHTAITNGLFIRRMEQANPTTPPILAVSLRDLWEGVNPLYNLGLGIEPDPARPGEFRTRIEHFKYFYQDTVALVHTDIADIKRQVVPGDHVSIFKFGYSKWEAEAFTGIDEFMTGREYRTELSQINQTFTAVSTFIASTFAIEVTRRLGNTTSEDWRYDKDVFLFAMKRDSGNLVVQQGDILSPANITDPASVLNFRLRPSQFALWWLPTILRSYRQAGFSDKIHFTDGTGNVYAEGWMNDGFCPKESHPMKENQDISPNDLIVPPDGLPIAFPERVVYTHPMTLPEFEALHLNPFELIDFSNDQDSGVAWIERVEYRVNDGIANFRLIPSR